MKNHILKIKKNHKRDHKNSSYYICVLRYEGGNLIGLRKILDLIKRKRINKNELTFPVAFL